MKKRVSKKRTDLVEVDLGDEIVVYDPQSDETHALSRTAASIWRKGTRTGLSRRQMLRRLTLAGAAIPAIQSVKTPLAVAAVSAMLCPQPGCGFPCPGNPCCACASTTEGANVCVVPTCPFPQTSCSSSSQCPPGTVCVTGIVSVCCEILGSFCIPLCTPTFTAGFCTTTQRAGKKWTATSPSWKTLQ